ncbi:FAD-dependent oxidoreductase [Vibrio campbellii]|uniref:FAD-dependent oxidoreductase n=1 Tax=Vibrio campbellii TaxID=680 RepID=A0AAQ3B0R8_9VIBR|nr:FAD-dependent oxidoreductase [Vibrio campbellii]WDG08972.1 FAD-dependent oxidoreductase [Vibrio campbellii]
MNTDILIVGGGLSGLALADKLERAGVKNWSLIEASERLGGRIYSPQICEANFDLGPSWFWPGQHRVEQLLRRFNLNVFEQFSKGMRVLQDEQGKNHPNRGYASMEGSLRIAGGMGRLIENLRKTLPNEKICLSTPLTSLNYDGHLIHAKAGKKKITAERVVLATPPRVAMKTIEFNPALPRDVFNTLTSIATWMAGQAKIIAVFDQPYWRQNGFSGDAMSLRGPMTEIHDASPIDETQYALFGFVGVPSNFRVSHQDQLLQLAKQQLVNIFGRELSNPTDIRIQDWAQIPEIATSLDQKGIREHPNYGYPNVLKNLWDGRLKFGSTEMAEIYGGYLEGALESAEYIFHEIMNGSDGYTVN